MLIKSTLLFVIAVFIGFATSPSYSNDIISCDSFETCPDGETSSTIIVGLQARIEEQEAKIAELEAEVIARTAYLFTASLSGAGLSNVRLRNANLDGANLTNANLRDAQLNGASLYHANLTGADLYHAQLTYTILRNANLQNANLNSANMTGSSLNEADLTNADLTDANLYSASLIGARWSNTTCPDGSNSDTHGGWCAACDWDEVTEVCRLP